MNAPAAIEQDEFALVGLMPDSAELLQPDRDPMNFVREHEGRVVLFQDDEPVPIGTFRAFYIDVDGAMCANVSPHDVFDTRQVTFDYLELYELEGLEYSKAVQRAVNVRYMMYEPNLLILDRLEILPRYRGRGYGLKALIAMMHWFQPGAGLVAMKPFPLQFEAGFKDDPEGDPLALASFKGGEITARTKLRRYYAQLGFSLVPKTQFMVRVVDQPAPVVPPAFR